MDIWLQSLILVLTFCQIGCNYDRPTRRELQTNKTIYMYSCIEKGVCKKYTEENGLKQIDCNSLCDLSWKWAHSESGSEPMLTLSPEAEATESGTTEMEGEGVSPNSSAAGLPFNKPNPVSQIGPHKVSLAEGGAEPRERAAQNRKQIGKAANFDSLNVIKSEEQKLAELKKPETKSNETNSSEAPPPENVSQTETQSESEQQTTQSSSASVENTETTSAMADSATSGATTPSTPSD